MVLSKGQKRERPSMRLDVLLGLAANSWGGGAVAMRHSVAKQAMFTPWLGGVKNLFMSMSFLGSFCALGRISHCWLKENWNSALSELLHYSSLLEKEGFPVAMEFP